MANLLVTGGAGFIGANFVQLWMQNNPDDRMVVVDLLTYAGNPANLTPVAQRPNYRFVQADICDHDRMEQLLREESIDTLVNFAAESHVDRSIHGPDAFIQSNVIGTHSLLKAAKKIWLDEGKDREHRFHHVSTDEVYGSLNSEEPPFHETSPYAPNSPYSASKAASDHLVRSYHHTYGLQVSTSNCSNNYGPYQFPEKLVPLVMINILGGKPLPIYGDGLNIRDWLYVDDHNRGLSHVIEQGRVGEVYNIGGNFELTNIEIVKLLCALMDREFSKNKTLAARFPDSPCARGEAAESLITFVKDRPGHDRRYAIDASKIETELGFIPHETFETGMAKTLSWYLGNEPWWQGIMDGSYRNWMQANYNNR
jgi:dTDP-glucose 4,6-dehydratase